MDQLVNAVMEKTALADVLAVDFVWSDMGAWDAIAASGEYGEALGSKFLGDFAADIIAGADNSHGRVSFGQDCLLYGRLGAAEMFPPRGVQVNSVTSRRR